ncbi:hypothetical protein PPERSA_03042 [Pseudocohnilembus persalinus]|uniref:Uncharacterized protein n=1 Tax=Pseudocohnilembus persalinus TaxID=266149 RepID=A0A0V0QEZ7_PSEPJ|nr:hypothetical protein PPERSA_03042 [Pseudocohnilembus persalinus]|eukprot:KRX00782.1 hypothetical protein PPERSA_03042 [Pseudocohnilembus persalinus]
MREKNQHQIQCSHCNEDPKKDMKENYQQGKDYVIKNFLKNKNHFNSEIIFHENQIQKCLLHSEIESEKHIYLHIDRTQQIAICFKCQIVYCAVCQISYEQKGKQLIKNCDCNQKYKNKLPCLICKTFDIYNTEFQVNMKKYLIQVPIGICQQHSIFEGKLKEEIQKYLEREFV